VEEFLKSPSQRLPEELYPGMFVAAHARRIARYLEHWADEIAGAKKKPHDDHPTKTKQGRKRLPRTRPTKKQQDAWVLHQRGLSHREVGRQLGISGTAAGKRIRGAQKVIERVSRSVRPRQKLPTDDRSQVST